MKFIDGKKELFKYNEMALSHPGWRAGIPRVVEELTGHVNYRTRFPIYSHIPEGDGTIARCRVVLNPKGKAIWIDMPISEFNRLKDTE